MESNCIFKKTDILHQVYVHNTKHPKKKKTLGSISEAMSVTCFILSAKWVYGEILNSVNAKALFEFAIKTSTPMTFPASVTSGSDWLTKGSCTKYRKKKNQKKTDPSVRIYNTENWAV